jgi:hypothetical protein
MSLDITIDRLANQKGPENMVELALVRIPGASRVRLLNRERLNDTEEEIPERKEPLDVWFITDRLDDILADAEAIFVESQEDAQLELQKRYGSVQVADISGYHWKGHGERVQTNSVGFTHYGVKVFMCMHGMDSTIGKAELVSRVKEEGSSTFLTSQHGATFLDSATLNNMSYSSNKRGVIEDDVYFSSEYVRVTFEDGRFTNKCECNSYLVYVKVFHDPKRAKRQASARKSADKRRVNGLPTKSALDTLTCVLGELGQAGSVNLRVAPDTNGYRPTREDSREVLVRLVEIQIALELPYRPTQWNSNECARALQSFKLVLASERGLLKDPVLAPVVPWLKDELEHLQSLKENA